jgi:hypothetical protein
MRFPVIPAEAGIQYFQRLISTLDSGFHRSDKKKAFQIFYETINF